MKTLTLAETPARHNRIVTYVEENNINFYDFNMEELYQAINFNYARDMNNNSTSGTKNAHANPYGAEKLTRFIGKILLDKYAIYPVYDSQWEYTRGFNEGLKKDFLLCHETTDLETYLSMINDSRYTIFIVAKGNAFSSLSENQQLQLNKLGLTTNWNNALKKVTLQ